MPTTTNLTVRAKGALWIVPCVKDATGKIESIGTPILIDTLTDCKVTYAKDAAASKQEVISVVTGTGVTLETPKKNKTIDASTGATKTVAGGGANGDKISATVLTSGKTMRRNLTALRGQTVLICCPSPESLDGSTEEDFQTMLGTLTSDVVLESKSETFTPIALEFTGGTAQTTTTAGATALAVDLAAITPRGETVAVDPPAITSGNVTSLLTGNVVDI